ncbi:MAG: hypothetical protein JJT96_18490 [Opitutales bacterium]|nr:hypothetical protein [Opitutales bacterium]
MQSPGDLQNYNRYGYVLNNPLSYTDPSGYFFKKLFRSVARFVKQYWKPILSIALVAFGQWYMLASLGSGGLGLAAGSAAHIFGSTLVGAAAGAITGGAQGAMWGALGGLAFSSIGALSANWNIEFKVLAHGITGGSMSEMQGGRFAVGFASAGISKAAGGWIGDNVPGEYSGQVIAHAVVGGTVSSIGGGKFANGAITGAFGHVFNSIASEQIKREHGRGGRFTRADEERMHPDRFPTVPNRGVSVVTEDGVTYIQATLSFFLEGGRPFDNESVIYRWVLGIEDYWSGVFDGVKVRTRVVIDQSADYAISTLVIRSTGRSQHGQWFSSLDKWGAAHEFGHILGLPDQYDISTNRPYAGFEGNIMASPNGRVWGRDIQEIRRINQRGGFNY